MRWKRVQRGLYKSEWTVQRPGGSGEYRFWIGGKTFEGYQLVLRSAYGDQRAIETWGPFNTVSLAKKVAAMQVGR